MAAWLMVALVLPPVTTAQDDEEETRTIAEVLAARANDPQSPEFNTLLSLILRADSSLFEALSDESAAYTFFAPTDDAFAALSRRVDPEVFSQITSDTAILTGVLLYHLIPQEYNAETLAAFVEPNGFFTLPTSFGQYVDLALDEEGRLTVDGITFELTEIPASNGTIYVLDSVLLPEVGTLQQVLMSYIDDEDPDIFGTYFLSAIQATEPEFEEELNSLDAQYTFFVPTEEAFNTIVLEGTFSELINSGEATTEALRYHILPERYGSFELLAALEEAGGTLTLDSLAGIPLTFVLQEDGTIRINDSATIIDYDIDAINGSVHVIDGVLLPPTE